MKKNHAFYKKDEVTGYWLVYCKNTKERFSTAVWDASISERNICPCCRENVNDD